MSIILSLLVALGHSYDIFLFLVRQMRMCGAHLRGQPPRTTRTAVPLHSAAPPVCRSLTHSVPTKAERDQHCGAVTRQVLLGWAWYT